MSKISQREAHALRRRVKQLEWEMELQRNVWSSEYPGGTHLGSVSWDAMEHIASAVYVAALLGHAIVAKPDGKKTFNLYALKQRTL
jgi:hypothetical protein